MSLTSILRKLENTMGVLAKELESRNMGSLAQSLHTTTMNMKIVGRISIFTYGVSRVFKDLSEEIDKISKRSKEEPSTIFEGLRDFVGMLSEAIPLAWSKYTRMKMVVLLLSVIYTITTMNFVNTYVTQWIASITTFILLCLGLALTTSITLDLMLSSFLIPLIPLVSAATPVIDVETFNQIKILAIVVHTVILVVSLVFVVKNIKEYIIARKSLANIVYNIENLIEVLRSAKIPEKQPYSDISMFTEIYGDKIFELIKYVNDMRKLSS